MRFQLSTALVLTLSLGGCGGDDGDGHDGNGSDDTGEVGTFEGLFDDVVTGFNFPFDIGIVPHDPENENDTETEGMVDGVPPGAILAANYGTSEILLTTDPPAGGTAEAFFAGRDAGLRGATAVSIPIERNVWATFEQGGEGDAGGIVVLDPHGAQLALIDGALDASAFARPGGICFGGDLDDGANRLFFFVNMGDGTAWRLIAGPAGEDPELTLVGSGLATGTAGNPGMPGAGLTSSNDLPQDGARGCAYHAGHLYVADAQNARVVRFDDAGTEADVDGVALENTPSELVTYPTDVAVNNEGALIVISYDNAHAFVSLETPSGDFVDNGLHDLNVNSGNYGTAVAFDTIWFTRANNSNGSLRAITQDQDHHPTTDGPFPAQ